MEDIRQSYERERVGMGVWETVMFVWEREIGDGATEAYR